MPGMYVLCCMHCTVLYPARPLPCLGTHFISHWSDHLEAKAADLIRSKSGLFVNQSAQDRMVV